MRSASWGRCLIPILTILTVLPASGPAGAVPPQAQPDPAWRLRILVRDAGTGEPLPARLTVRDLRGTEFYPLPRNSSFFHRSYVGLSYFYADGQCELNVPAGRFLITTAHGFEYVARTDTVEVSDDVSFEVDLRRCIDMRAGGWRSGDTHVHMTHGGINVYQLKPADLFLMQRAEDVNAVSALENGLGFTGGVDPLSTADYLLDFAVEYRSAFWGHLAVLGTSALTSFGCCSRGQPAFPMNIDLAQQARALGGTVIFAHPSAMTRDQMAVVDQGWPSVGMGRELPIDVALGAVDAMDVYSYSNVDMVGYEPWYDMLNHGFHLPATAGTDASMNRFNDPPLGGFRVYARVGAGPWTYSGWLEAIRRGESFITNGPLVTAFTVQGQPMGSTLPVTETESHRVTVFVGATCQWPMERAEIIVNGMPAGSVYPDRGGRRIYGHVDVDLAGKSAWVAAHIFGYSPNPVTVGSELEAHTNPVYLVVPHEPVRFGGVDPGYYLSWVDEVTQLAETRGFASLNDENLLEDRLRRAREILVSRSVLSTTRVGGDDTPLPERGAPGQAGGGTRDGVEIRVEPNPSRGTVRFRFGGGSAFPEGMTVFDVSGRRLFSYRLPQAGSADEWSWDPADAGLDLRPGVYFVRFHGNGWMKSVRLVRTE